jgi:hypothetical protein
MTAFATPLAFLGLLTLAGLAVVYLLRNRFQPQWVSSLMLWRQVSRVQQGGPVLHRFRAPWLFLLELLILALLTLAAAQPEWLRPQARRSLSVVLDDSASMTARGPDGHTPAERAASALLREQRDGRFRRVRLFLAGPQPRLLATLAPESLASALQDWKPGAPAADLDRALALAAETAPPGEAFLVLTDHAPATPAAFPALRWLACGAPLPNRAFVHAVRAPDQAGADWISIEVASYSPDPSPVRVTLRGDKVEPAVHTVQPTGAKPQRLRIPLPPGAGKVTLTLDPDALEADNTVVLLPRIPRKVRSAFQFASADAQRLLTRAVEAADRALPGGPEPDLVWTDSATNSPGPGAWVVEWHMPAGAKPQLGPFLVQPLHPLLEGLSFDGVAWGAAPVQLPGLPLVMAGDIPLITLEERTGRPPHLHFQLVTRFSTLQATPAWPALVANILDWRATALPGFESPNAIVNQPVRLAPPGDRAVVVLRGPETVTLRAGRSGPLTWFPVQPGLYEFPGKGGALHAVAVNWLAPAESDLRPAASGAWGQWNGPGVVQQEAVSFAWAFGLAALALLAVHQAVLARREAPA